MSARQATPTTAAARPRAVFLGITVALVALNLRPALAAVGPVLLPIERSTGLSAPVAGLLSTVPVLAFGLFAVVAPRLGRRFGLEAAVAGVLVLLVAGIAVRSAPGLVALFAGTVALGVAIAVGNVLVPALVKRDFPASTRVMMATYAVALSAGAALGAGLTVPIDHATGAGWRGALALWAVPAAVCLVLWALSVRGSHHDVGPVHVSSQLWRDPLAWQVTIYMGMQSLGFYTMLAWLPTLFEQHGVHAAPAGWLLSLSGFASLPAAFVAPVLGSSPRRQQVAVVAAGVCIALAMGGLLWRPVTGAVAWMVLLGVGQGVTISLALSFVVFRAPTVGRAAELSAMAQAVGYVLASVGPFAIGALRAATGSWTVPLVVLLVALVPQLVTGLGAARPLSVGQPLVNPGAQHAGSGAGTLGQRR